MFSFHVDSELTLCDIVLLPKTKNQDLNDNAIDNFPFEFVTIETLQFLTLNTNFIDT